MVRIFAGAVLASLLVFAPFRAAEAAFCKTLKGEWVDFGEDSTRKEAESRLDNEIAAWREHYSITAVTPKSRKATCRVYMTFLNEYLCTAEAVVCR